MPQAWLCPLRHFFNPETLSAYAINVVEQIPFPCLDCLRVFCCYCLTEAIGDVVKFSATNFCDFVWEEKSELYYGILEVWQIGPVALPTFSESFRGYLRLLSLDGTLSRNWLFVRSAATPGAPDGSGMHSQWTYCLSLRQSLSLLRSGLRLVGPSHSLDLYTNSTVWLILFLCLFDLL